MLFFFESIDLPFALMTAQATFITMKIVYYILLALIPLFCASCWTTIPPGEAPAGGIVKVPPEPVQNIMTGKMAVNYMTTSLVLRCPALSGSGKDKPLIMNEFVISVQKVNHFQMQVWRSLINMKMINPVSDMKNKPTFRLSSEITRLPERIDEKYKYSWIMSMDRISDKKEIWRAEIVFVE